MARNSTPRKRHAIKANDPVLLRFSEEDERLFQLAPHAELTNLMHGSGTEASWDTLELRIKWGQALAVKKGLTEVAEQLTNAFKGLLEVHGRFLRVQKYGTSGDEAVLIGTGLNLADDLQLKATRRDLRDTLNETRATLRASPAAGRVNCLA